MKSLSSRMVSYAQEGENVMTKTPVIAWLGMVLLSSAAAAQEASERVPSWMRAITPYGDFRYRHEVIDREGLERRTRQRIRVRLGFEARVTEDVDLGFRLATGGTDPISTNQTLGEGLTSKAIALDFAYFDWHPGMAAGLHLLGGKMKNPFFSVGKSQLIWDSDLTPEGIAASYTRAFGSLEAFGTFGGFWVQERSQDDDTGLLGAQGGFTFKVNNKAHLGGGLSYYTYPNVRGMAPMTSAGSAGNTLDLSNRYANEFNEVEVFAEGGFDGYGIPVALIGHYVMNRGAQDDNVAWLAGLVVGKCKDAHTWEIRYSYRKVERDAVLGAFCDSDFGGGGTDAEGHVLSLDYKITSGVQGGITYFRNKIRLANPQNYQNLQVDLSLSF